MAAMEVHQLTVMPMEVEAVAAVQVVVGSTSWQALSQAQPKQMPLISLAATVATAALAEVQAPMAQEVPLESLDAARSSTLEQGRQ
jgi:hypothetical protein